MIKRVLAATLAGGVVSYLLGWLIFITFLDGDTSQWGSATGVQKTDFGNIWALLLGYFVGAYLLAHIFAHWAGVSTPGSGLKSGALVGLLVWSQIDLVLFGTTNVYSWHGIWTDILCNTIIYACAGAVIGWILGYKRST